ncbi:glycogen/starch/alpha-glucan phosphorylase [Carnobacterium maltaromaticum]|uniref:glycogen/starch/alpha-glucan phosphorylase n=1 Tax=Carnobacterium maltaromaticum TaxID=2751 RepID=UPI0012F762E3|nr:glycogen/starch/alpha-glucan phosphorylase [Carnobacterium maltaromaticum]
MELTKKRFKEDFQRTLKEVFAIDIEEASAFEQYFSLGRLVKAYTSDEWQRTNKRYLEKQVKQVYYFSIEFLPGHLLKSNLLNLSILKLVREGLSELGISLEKLEDAEPDPALGNGGLGRLAACFMDSMASTGIPGNGNGIRYRYGLFKQKFLNGYQVELPENWLRNGNVWEVRKENKGVTIKFGGTVTLIQDKIGKLKPVYENSEIILAVPYDIPMIGYKNNIANNLRLWSAESPLHGEGEYSTEEQREDVKRITEVLYPDDSNYEGQLLRLKQEYFFVSAGIQSIVRHYKKLHLPFDQMPEKIAVHINDTHPTLCIPELMRILMDEENLSWEVAWDITVKVMSYTNHTIMAEALEKWSEDMIKLWLPRMYQIICEINRRYVETMRPLHGEELVQRTMIIRDGYIKMAHLAIIGSHSTNGVAKLHSDLLKEKVLHDLYTVYPMRFNNKTNGIAQRRWVQLANEDLAKVLDETIGLGWRRNPSEMTMLKAFQNDEAVLAKLDKVKLKNKMHFTAYVEEEMGIKINPKAIFDVQIKRLHAYKRQLMNVLEIIGTYLELKDNPDADIYPRVHIFGAKAAPSYTYAKQIIKLMNSVATLINNDKTIQDKLKLVFIENYGVSLAEKIIPAADVSEQISLATKEASGTSNMKLMLNGAITVATLDGANVEIRDSVGSDNIVLFGLTEEEVYQYYHDRNYNAKEIYETDPKIHRILNALIDGTIPGIQDEGHDIFDSLILHNDEYFVLKDFSDYAEAKKKIDLLYSNRQAWNKMSLLNIASAGHFSSDYTVLRYAEDIWDVEHFTKIK